MKWQFASWGIEIVACPPLVS